MKTEYKYCSNCEATFDPDCDFVKGYYSDSKSTSDIGFNPIKSIKNFNQTGKCPLCDSDNVSESDF